MLQSPAPKDNPSHNQLPEFDGYIDLGRQLSILHSLLSECVSKVSGSRSTELSKLQRILDRVGNALAQPATYAAPGHAASTASAAAAVAAVALQRQHESVSQPHTPSYQSLQRNIFR